MIVTIEILLPHDDTSDEIVRALDGISNHLSDVGYNDAEFTKADCNGVLIPYRVVRGTNTGR